MKAEKQPKTDEEIDRLGPVCWEHIDKGLAHVLSLKVPDRKDILRIHFGLSEVDIDASTIKIYKLDKAGMEQALCMLIQSAPVPAHPPVDAEAARVPALPPVDAEGVASVVNNPNDEIAAPLVDTDGGEDITMSDNNNVGV